MVNVHGPVIVYVTISLWNDTEEVMTHIHVWTKVYNFYVPNSCTVNWTNDFTDIPHLSERGPIISIIFKMNMDGLKVWLEFYPNKSKRISEIEEMNIRNNDLLMRSHVLKPKTTSRPTSMKMPAYPTIDDKRDVLEEVIQKGFTVTKEMFHKYFIADTQIA